MSEMQISEFRRLVESEPERAVVKSVSPVSPALIAMVDRKGSMKLTDLLAAPGRRSEERVMRYRHILGPGAAPEEMQRWQPLPIDLEELVGEVNGVHLWANVDTGRAYAGLAPIQEWKTARTQMYGTEADPNLLDDRSISISYHADNAAFIVMDMSSGVYFLMDAAGPDTTTPIAKNAGELLDWLWSKRIAPAPSTES
jgi:hypothetical protein